ncbi:acyltransferase family protein [Silvimonas soli]|uniref:acyltransferase family protein n=1 Tax=Silvimonas soli TaxID=2980100 RepID=UPI0024B3B341|nr:acyltransferase family protein [Silvimonas soli]
MHNRIRHLDLARGIGILLIVLGHNRIFDLINPVGHHILHSINMPMFFLMSGVFFKASTSISSLALQKLDGVLKPVFVTLLLVAPLQPLLSHAPFAQFVAGSLYATGGTLRWTPLWFLPHLFLVFMAGRIYLEVAKRWQISRRMSLLIGLCCITSTYFMFQTMRSVPVPIPYLAYGNAGQILGDLGLPFSADLLLITVPIFLMGHALKEQISTFEPRVLYALAALAVFGLMHYLGDGELNLSKRLFEDFLFNVGQTLCGVYLVLSVSVWTSRYLPGLRWLLLQAASASLFILLFHDYLQRRSFRFFEEHGLSMVAAGMLAYLSAIILPTLFYQIVVRVRWLAVLWLPVKRVQRNRALNPVTVTDQRGSVAP